jgi:hypothetical protein
MGLPDSSSECLKYLEPPQEIRPQQPFSGENILAVLMTSIASVNGPLFVVKWTSSRRLLELGTVPENP